MPFLHNRVNRRLLKNRIRQGPDDRVTLSFYKYHRITDPADFRDQLYQVWAPLGVLGRIYVAQEGINAQLSVPREHVEDFRKTLDATGFLKDVRLNIAIQDDARSFFVLKIAVKKKIVSDGLRDETFNASDSGEHLSAEGFNRLSEQSDTVIVDMRNHYESEVGHFRNALLPDVDTFKEALPVVEQMLDDKKEKNIIMYCTGGIRCEKASAWMKHRGFKHVFQLDGGIIEYARQVKAQGLENKFIGKNFVFDDRLGERISQEVISVCHQCGAPCDTHTNCKNDGCHLLFIQCDACAAKYNGCCSEECKEVIALPAEAQKEMRKGKAQQRKVFHKGRSPKIRFKGSA
jgi:UPF0176 protein